MRNIDSKKIYQFFKYSLLIFIISCVIFFVVTALNDGTSSILTNMSVIFFYILAISGVESICLYFFYRMTKNR